MHPDGNPLMSSVDLIRSVLDDRALDHNEFRNILLAGDIDSRRLAALVKRHKGDAVKIITPSDMSTVGQMCVILTNLKDSEILVVDGLDGFDEDVLQNLADCFRDRKLDIEIGTGGEKKIVCVNLPNFFTICTMSAYASIGNDIYQVFDLKLAVGNQTRILIDDTGCLDSTDDEIRPRSTTERRNHAMTDTARYLRIDKNTSAATASIVYEVTSFDEKNIIYGAYYGYTGGGVNDGGFFEINIEDDVNTHLDYSDIDELGETNPALKNKYEVLISKVWEVIDDSDGDDSITLNDFGKRLIAASDDKEVYMDGDFDGDLLAEISTQWKLTLKFED